MSVVNPNVDSILAVRFDVAWRAMNLAKDQTIFTLFLFEETMQASNYRAYRLAAEKNTEQSGIVAHRAIGDLVSLIYLTGPPTAKADITTAENLAVNTITLGAGLSFNFFFRTCLEHHMYYRQNYAVTGLTSNQYVSKGLLTSSPTITSFDPARIAPWSSDIQAVVNAFQITGNSMGFCMFIYEEGCQILNALMRAKVKAGDSAGAAAIARKYLPEIVPLVNWTSLNPANMASTATTIYLTKGLSLFYLNFFKATLRTFLYCRSLDPDNNKYNGITLTDMQYIDQNGNLATMPSTCALTGSVMTDSNAVLNALGG